MPVLSCFRCKAARTARRLARVGNAVPSSLVIMPTSVSLPKGATQSFSASAVMTDSTKQNVTGSTTWVSANPSVASIDANGNATAAGAGTTVITGTYQSFTANASVTVSNNTITSISIAPAVASAAKGTASQFAANAVLSDGSTQNISGSATWTASPSSVCTVNSASLATAVGVGSCAISASSSSVTGNAALNVTAATLVSISLSPHQPCCSRRPE